MFDIGRQLTDTNFLGVLMKRAASADPKSEQTAKSQRSMASSADDVRLGEDPEFQGLRGQLLVEAIFKKYGAGTMTIPWLHPETGARNIVRDVTNRPIMESLAEAYADRILTSGLNVDCSGRGFAKWWVRIGLSSYQG